MRPLSVRLRLAIVMLAWLAQAFMPVAHAAVMAGAKSGGVWCGDQASAAQALALLPAELRAALDDGSVTAEHIADCALLCAVGPAPLPPTDIAPVAALRAAGIEPARVALTIPTARAQAPTPPAHAPPARA